MHFNCTLLISQKFSKKHNIEDLSENLNCSHFSLYSSWKVNNKYKTKECMHDEYLRMTQGLQILSTFLSEQSLQRD